MMRRGTGPRSRSGRPPAVLLAVGLIAVGLLVAPILPGPSFGPVQLEAQQLRAPGTAGGVGDLSGAPENPGSAPSSARVLEPQAPGWSAFQAQELPVSPRGAFLRSLVLPGWGHLSVDSPGRAAFYVAAQGGSAWMLGKSVLRRQSARRFRDEEFLMVWDELRAQGIQSPDSLRLGALGDARVERWQELVDIRGDQVEDWLALSIFLALLSATDALVAAHMADYPEPLSFDVVPRGRMGGWELRLRLPVGRGIPGGR